MSRQSFACSALCRLASASLQIWHRISSTQKKLINGVRIGLCAVVYIIGPCATLYGGRARWPPRWRQDWALAVDQAFLASLHRNTAACNIKAGIKHTSLGLRGLSAPWFWLCRPISSAPQTFFMYFGEIIAHESVCRRSINVRFFQLKIHTNEDHWNAQGLSRWRTDAQALDAITRQPGPLLFFLFCTKKKRKKV